MEEDAPDAPLPAPASVSPQTESTIASEPLTAEASSAGMAVGPTALQLDTQAAAEFLETSTSVASPGDLTRGQPNQESLPNNSAGAEETVPTTAFREAPPFTPPHDVPEATGLVSSCGGAVTQATQSDSVGRVEDVAPSRNEAMQPSTAADFSEVPSIAEETAPHLPQEGPFTLAEDTVPAPLVAETLPASQASVPEASGQSHALLHAYTQEIARIQAAVQGLRGDEDVEDGDGEAGGENFDRDDAEEQFSEEERELQGPPRQDSGRGDDAWAQIFAEEGEGPSGDPRHTTEELTFEDVFGEDTADSPMEGLGTQPAAWTGLDIQQPTTTTEGAGGFGSALSLEDIFGAPDLEDELKSPGTAKDRARLLSGPPLRFSDLTMQSVKTLASATRRRLCVTRLPQSLHFEERAYDPAELHEEPE
eukprot:RCo055246